MTHRPNKPPRHPFRAAWTYVRTAARKLLHMRTDAHQIALGFAVGVFIGIFPTFGLGFFVITLIAVVIRFNVPAAVLGTAIANPFLAPFWLLVSYKVGKVVTQFLPIDPAVFPRHPLVQKFLDHGVDYLIGNTVVSAVFAILSYPVVLFAVKYFAARRAARRQFYQERQKQKEGAGDL